MEFAHPISNLRTQLCIALTGLAPTVDRDAAWSPAAEDFLRRIHKLGAQITIIGPRPPRKFGSKKTIRFMDRHEIIGMKLLQASRSHRLEFRVLNGKTKAWTRLRAETCVTVGSHGVWPAAYEGWTVPGTLSIDALARWVGEQKTLPGREFVFIGSSNQVLRWASSLLDRGAKSCYVVEQGKSLACWRAYRDRFVAKGGRILLDHRIQRVETASGGMLAMYLDNAQGTLIVNADIVVTASVNQDTLNAPEEWKHGLFYVQRRRSPWDQVFDEEQWLERVDWRETYWRVAKLLKSVDHAEAEGALRLLRAERRELHRYRKDSVRRELGYSGKILDRDSIALVQSSPSVPRSFARSKPVASLECLEDVPCRACADACPESAIDIAKLTDQPRLLEECCTGCGACVAACPAGAAIMISELPLHQKARYFLPDDTRELWKPGRSLQLLNRKGDVLGAGRVVSSAAYEGGAHRIVEVEATNVHLWEARNFRASREEFADPMMAADSEAAIPAKRGWITLNGVRRRCPVDVPVTVALWQLGQKRFEDALFCHDGSCHLCEVEVDGTPALACKTLVRDGQRISFSSRVVGLKGLMCPCKEVAVQDYMGTLEEGASSRLAREITGLGHGTCHGRWCLASSELATGEKLRPVFHGYETSPWRDIWASDVVESRPAVADGDEGESDS